MENVVQAWDELLDSLRDAGGAVIRDAAQPIDAVEGLGYVLQVLGDQFDRAAMRNSARPLFAPAITPFRKLFFDNPDTDYSLALVSGRREYLIRGTRGNATYLAFCAYAGNPSQTGTTRKTNISDADIVFGSDGRFELVCSAERPPDTANWLPLAADTHAIIARHYFLDRAKEDPARLEIETFGDTVPDRPLDARRFARVARQTAQFVEFATSLAARRVAAGRQRPNRFVAAPGDGAYGTPDADYVICWYELREDEALVIDVQPPDCRYWGVHLANRWGQSLDHRTRTISCNGRTARRAADGSVRIVVAHTDPGEANWLDTAGHPEGWILFRWLISHEVARPDATVVPLPTGGTRG